MRGLLWLHDRDLGRRAVLAGAYGRCEKQVMNGVGSYSFCLPGDDSRAERCAPMWFVREGDGDFYRLLADGMTETETGERRFEAEHGIATLLDDVMFGTHIVGGHEYGTRRVLEYILDRQTVRRWQLGECDFDEALEYCFESENLLRALLSVAEIFAQPYQWVYDMRTTPWTLSLKRLDADAPPAFALRAGRNVLSTRTTRTGETLCTRLFLLGYGEGDNQLTIRGVNGGVPYLESPREYIERYGLISKVYIDRSYEDARSLMERGRALLTQMQEPRYTRTFEAADLSALSGQACDSARVGDVARLTDGTRALVTAVTRRLDVDGDMQVELSTRPGDLESVLATIAGRQLDEQKHPQGATQLFAQSVQANATPDDPAELRFIIPEEMRYINKVLVMITLDRFRSYARVTAGGGGYALTSSDGGGMQATSGAAGQATRTSSAGGGARVTSEASSRRTTSQSDLESTYPNTHFVDYAGLGSGIQTGIAAGRTGASNETTGSSSSTSTYSAGVSIGAASGGTYGPSHAVTGLADGKLGTHAHSLQSHTHGLGGHTHGSDAHSHVMLHTHSLNNHTHSLNNHTHDFEHTHGMDHTHGFGHSHTIDHTHEVAVPAHTHTVETPAHTHTVSVPAHSHSVQTPAHTHQIEQGIFRFGNPKTAAVLVGGQQVMDMGLERDANLTELLVDEKTGKIPRGRWIRLGVRPDDLAYVTIDVVVQGFIQSRGGGLY